MAKYSEHNIVKTIEVSELTDETVRAALEAAQKIASKSVSYLSSKRMINAR